MKQSVATVKNTLTLCSSAVLKILGLALVVVVIYAITDSKLDRLRYELSQIVSPGTSAKQRMSELECLTKNIYWEAAHEPFEGKVGVAQVTLNRVESGKFASSVCGVVYQKNVFYEKIVCQFSWFCEGNHRVKPIHQAAWTECEEVAKRVLLEGFRLPSLRTALYYHADYVNPGWKLPRIEKIGRHIFYGDRV